MANICNNEVTVEGDENAVRCRPGIERKVQWNL